MCGIAGSVDLVLGLEPAEELVASMTDMLRHRGPDDAGMLVDRPVVLGHRRLSIIDLSPAGHQPMASEDDSIWITYNGEIYNYVELREELRQLGREFHTASDTEVLVQAYAAWGGPGMLERLNGMFAFALWDRCRRTVLLARDRFGVKPLYYVTVGGRFRFASEIKALFADPAVPRRPNDARVLDFLAYGLSDHMDETMFEGVLQLRPGTYLELEPLAEIPPATTWYRPRPAKNSGAAAHDRVRHLLESAVALRLRSDVPVGVSLSGGMDSSSVLAVASAIRSQKGIAAPRSFTARSSDPARDEYRFLQRLLRTTGSLHVDTLPTADGVLAELDSVIWHQDEPFHSPSVYGQRKVHELARSKGVIVLLDGQGGDEVLSGYHHFHYPALLLALVRRGRLLAFAREVGARRRRLGTSATRSLKDVVRLLVPSRRRPKPPAWLARGAPLASAPVPGTSLPSHQDYGLETFPLPAYNHHADRNSMTFSLETRNPFLDVRLVEAARAMKSEDLLHDGYTKWALREGVRDIVPAEIVDRAEKQGFTTDEALWFRERLGDELAAMFGSASVAARGYFDQRALLAELDEHLDGARDRAFELWRAYVTERWLRLFIDPDELQAPPPPDLTVPSRTDARNNVVRLAERGVSLTSAPRAG